MTSLNSVAPGWRQRLRAAFRIVFGRHDDTACCSFCGRDRWQAASIIVGPGVAICGDCVQLAKVAMGESLVATAPAGMAQTALMVFEDPACLLPAHRASLQSDLTRMAKELGCSLLGWTYSCALPSGDRLTVVLACPDGGDRSGILQRFLAAAQGGSGADAG